MDREIPLPNIFNGNDPLHVAVRSGQVEDVRKVLDQQLVDVNYLNSKHETPLHLARSLRQKDKIIVLLIAFGADPFIKDSDGNTAYDRCSGEVTDLMNKMFHHNNLWINGPDNTDGDTLLHSAVRQGDLANAQRLILKQNISVNDINASYETPLHLACALGHEPIVHLLVSNGADMYKIDCYNNAPIHRAVAKGHVEVSNLLIATFSCDPKITGYQGRTLLHFASAIGNIELINTAIEEYDISPLASDSIGKTPLHIAACHGQEEVVSLLIAKYNSPVDCRSGCNHTALHLACYSGHISCIKRLICVHKADLNLCDDYGDTLLHKACLGGNIDVVKLLITEFNANNIHALNCKQSSPMMWAAIGGHAAMVKTLINEFQCNPHEKGYDGMSLLHCACNKGHTKLAVMLITEFKLGPCLADDSGNTPLHMACGCGHEELARLLISKYNCSVDDKDKQNETPLHKACGSGHINVVKMLVGEYKADLSARNYQRNIPMHRAALGGHKDIVESLINEFQCDPHEEGYDGRSLLHFACEKGHTKLAEMLITDYQLDPCLSDDNGDTPLHMACWGGHKKLARLLITKYNCPVDVKNKQNETPLHKACFCGHVNVVKMLVTEFGADLNERDNANDTPLSKAVLGGHTDLVRLVIEEFKCNSLVKGFEGRSLLHQACSKGHTKLAVMLITEFKLDPCLADDSGNTPLHMACWCGHEELARLLITEYNRLVDVKNEQNETPLHKACGGGYINVVKMLVTEFGADLNERDNDNDTPLSKAVLGGHTDLVGTLIKEYNCNPKLLDEKCANRSLLHYACYKGHTKLAMMLSTEFQLDPCLADDSGNTPLHMACWGGHEELARLLISKYNCPVDVNNKQNETPLHKACGSGHINVVKMLVGEYKADLSARNYQRNIPMHVAALGGHKDIVESLINEFQCNPHEEGYDGRSLLHFACEKGHTKLAVMLITEFKLGTCLADDSGNTPLHMACVGGHINVVKMLVTEFGAELNERDNENVTPLSKAVLGGHTDLVRMLIEEFMCSPLVKGFAGRSLLHQACSKGHTKLAEMLITEFQLDPCLTDDSGNTPLHMACWCGHEELPGLLISKYNCPVDVNNKQNETPLHKACGSGHINVVKILVGEYKADLSARNYQRNIPMHVAALGGHKDIVESLINVFQCNPHEKGYDGRSLLHFACEKGHTKLAEMLITEFKLGTCLADDSGNTPLHMACWCGHEELARLVITKYKCPIDVKDNQNKTSLYLACTEGHVNVVRMLSSVFVESLKENPLNTAIDSGNTKAIHVLYTECGDKISIKGHESKPFLHQVVYGGGSASMLRELISSFGHDPACVDDDGNTLLHTAAQCGKEEIVQMLAREYSGSCPIDSRNSQGQTPLHRACVGGHVGVVKSLLSHKASVYIRDKKGHTPIKYAHLLQNSDVLFAIFSVLGFHSRTVDSQLLHQVCGTGTVEFIDYLLSDFELDPSTLNEKYGNSLLHTAVSHGRLDMAKLLLEKYKLESYVECRNSIGQTPLHLICSQAPRDSVEGLLDFFIHNYNADITSEDNKGYQPIQSAAEAGCTDVVTTLISNYGCDSMARGLKHRSLLHLALANGFPSTGKTLIDKFNLSVHCTDDDGNTPLHLSSLSGQRYSVRILLYDYHAPVFVRNKAGKAALDLAKNETIKSIFEEYVRSKHKSIQAEYEQLQSLSRQKYSGKQRITRIFVLGNVGSGKSTLVKSLKTKGFPSLFAVSAADVPPHTAGIVPSLYENKDGGRFLYYDFAGDKEYYSSHSAILEIVTQSSVGTSVYVIVANLTKDILVLFNEIGYWLSFISYHAKVVDSAYKLKVVIVLSHSDRISAGESSSKSDSIKQFLQTHENNYDHEVLDIIDVITSNCRKPRSSRSVEDTLQQISKDTSPRALSFEPTLLHGLLEKDFSNVVACKFRDLVNHVKDTGIYLPAAAVALHPIVKELHDIGLLMMIGRSDEPLENHLLLLNPCTLTNEVHRNLFSMEAKPKFTGSRYAEMGIMPESLLHDLLPEHITKECLIQLQYCQEFSHTEVGVDYTVTPDASESKENLLYFPALCNLQTKSANWSSNPDLTFSMGWYAKCKGVFNYFPARFLHVVLLRLAFSLALPMASCSVSDSYAAQAYGRRCTMWKKGIHWLMEEGVECTFEMVDDNKGIVAITRAKKSSKRWATILGKIVSIALKAKSEFCNSVTLHQHLLNSADPLSFKDEDKLFDMNDVRRVLKEGKENVLSVVGEKLLDSSCLSGLKGNTYWGMYEC